MSFLNAYVVTGGIATGKSTFLQILKPKHLIDADKIAHKLLDANAKKISELFGLHCIKDGKVNRQALGKLVFEDKKQLKKLEQLLHPLIYEKIVQKCQELEKLNEPYFVDIPLFFEKDVYKKLFRKEHIILVYASRKTQLERLKQRNALSKLDATKRLDAQLDIEEKLKKSAIIVDNSRDLEHLKSQIAKIKSLIKAKTKA